MKTLFRTLLAGAALAATPALAADAIVEIPQPPIAVAAEPAFTWTGAYIGLQGGYVDGGNNVSGLFADAEAGAVDADITVDGFIGGVHAGYNVQFGGGFVLGAYADIDFDIANDNIDLEVGGDALPIGDLDYIARGMVKAGFGFGRALAYAQGGLAYVSAEAGSPELDAFGADGARVDIDSFGYAVGAGLDFAVTEKIVVGGDYLYHNFDDFDTGDVDLDLDVHTFRAKLAYKF